MNRHSKHIFGPVPSRRLGLSLGVDIIPFKTCTLDCIYCEVGETDKKTLLRKEYYPTDEVLAEVFDALQTLGTIDYLTFSGSGEPTLHSGLGVMIDTLKKKTGIPVCVITNGTLLHLPDVREDLKQADVVIPSLDAATEEVFLKINRPHPKLSLSQMIDGMVAFRKQYKGQLWLEILFAKGINDTDTEIQQLKAVIERLNPHKIQLNTVVRPPADSSAEPVDEKRLQEINSFLGGRCEIIGHYSRKCDPQQSDIGEDAAIRLLQMRAMTVEGMASALHLPQGTLARLLQELESSGKIIAFWFEGQQFFRAKELSSQIYA
ncbi:MAG: radical SAM protein [bacterium]